MLALTLLGVGSQLSIDSTRNMCVHFVGQRGLGVGGEWWQSELLAFGPVC